MDPVVEAAQHRRTVRVPVDRRHRHQVQMQPVEHGGRGVERQLCQRLDGRHVRDDEDPCARMRGEDAVPGGGDPPDRVQDALATGRWHRRIGQPGVELVGETPADLAEGQSLPGAEVGLPHIVVDDVVPAEGVRGLAGSFERRAVHRLELDLTQPYRHRVSLCIADVGQTCVHRAAEALLHRHRGLPVAQQHSGRGWRRRSHPPGQPVRGRRPVRCGLG